MVKHFGLNIRETKNGLKLTRENYVVMNNRSSFTTGNRYSIDWMRKHAIYALINYDINMEYFKSLNNREFNECIDNFLKQNSSFKKVEDLNDLKGISGYYMLVLDEYSQAYIGTSDDIFKRIYKHWHKRKPFDRLIFGAIESSIMSIASFRPLDTTRIYVLKTKSTYSFENRLINNIPEKFMCNRTWGGRLEGGLDEAILFRKSRIFKSLINYDENSFTIKYNKELTPEAVHLHEIYFYFMDEYYNSIKDKIFSFSGKYGVYDGFINPNENVIYIEKIKSAIKSENEFSQRKKLKRMESKKRYYEKNKNILRDKYRKKYHLLRKKGIVAKQARNMASWSEERIKDYLLKHNK